MQMKYLISSKLFLLVLIFSLLFIDCQDERAEYFDTSFRILDEVLDTEEYGVGFRVNDIALGLEVQKIFDKMIADGTISEISQKWFNEDLYINDGPFWKESVAPTNDSSLIKVKQKGYLVVGIEDNFPPISFTDEDGMPVGAEIELATEVCKRLGVEVRFEFIDWGALESVLNTGLVDCIWNGMTINDTRLSFMFVAKSYMQNRQIAVVKEKSDIYSLKDLANKIIAVQRFSTAIDAVNNNQTIMSLNPKPLIKQFPNNEVAYQQLKVNWISMWVVDEIVGKWLLTYY